MGVETFLQEIGLPPEYLDSFRQRVAGASFYSCFISHSTTDAKFCRKLYYRMKAEGLRVFYAPERLKGGRVLYEQLTEAIQSHDKFLLVLSEESMKSSWVELEIRKALEDERTTGSRKLFPITVSDFGAVRAWRLIDSDTGQDLAVRVREYFIPDFSAWQDDESFEEAFRKLIEDLRGGKRPAIASESENQASSSEDGLTVRVWQ